MPIVDIDWLKEHVEVPEDLTVEQLAADLVRVGLEEEDIHTSSVTGPLVVGKIVDFTPEPQKNGKTINWCHVDVGEKYNATDENGNKVPRGIICGAPNVGLNELVVVALPGAVLPGDFEIASRKTYGHISDGMCCSERELGLSDEHNGIILLREQGYSEEEFAALELGQDAIHLLHLDRPTLEINITPDRGYAFSYRGVAREYHHSTGRPYVDPIPELLEKAPKASEHGDVEVLIEDDNPIHGVPGADRYYARAIHGYNPAAHTPNWMRRRLTRAGMRPISLAVDVTNYLMLDLGQPMHAYDLDKINPPIVVRRAHEGEHLTTLDDKDRPLSTEDLLITDSPNGEKGSRIIGLAGVMGGLYGEITAETKNILVECAHFDQVTIARTARRHKLPSEASRRFERGVDTAMQPGAAQAAVELLSRYGSGEPSSNPTDVNATAAPEAISFKVTEVKRLADLDVSADQISDILTDIGCTVAGGGNGVMSVVPPTWRPDITMACDLVEEVARLVGYDEIPVTVPSAPVKDTGLTPDQQRQRWVANTLAESGLVETLSYPFVGDADYKAFGLDTAAMAARSVEITNPLGGDRPYLRTDLLHTLALTAQRNIRRGIDNVQIYEIGHVFHFDPAAPAVPALPGGVKPNPEQLAALDAGLPDQPLAVAGLLTGEAVTKGWYEDARAIDWSDAVSRVRRIGERLGIDLSFAAPKNYGELPETFESATWHPGRTALVSLPDGTWIGVAGELHPQVSENLGIPAHSAAFELNLTALFNGLSDQPLQAKPISTFPPVKQDLAFSVDESVTSAQLEATIAEAAGDVLESIQLFDVFHGSADNDALGAGKKSLAYAVVFRSPSKTLTAEDSEAIRASIVDKAQVLGAQLRS
ncbi:MAG: phenylalanine--tRNA ligase subunit beta [Bifidobacteriaceae bacterium]|jgi:phenylalanyl-tRNA synthetase beta chain|nr:phenylalanine--tRNA ligase subunit beta [Bifidobacteriaceae bacterium]